MHMYAGLKPGAVAAPPAVAALLANGEFLPPPAPSAERTMLFIGDSITAGSGALGVPPCNGDINTTDVTVAVGPLLAANFSAQLLGNVAVSGIGVLNNCCDDGPTMASRAHATFGLDGGVEGHDWNVPTRPQAVIIGLGTNDFYKHNASNATFVAAFVDAYAAFVVDLAMNRLSNGSVAFFLAVGPITDVYGPAVAQVVARTRALGLPVHSLNYMGAALDGCGGHPGVIGHAQMAAAAQPVIASVMGWGATPLPRPPRSEQNNVAGALTAAHDALAAAAQRRMRAATTVGTALSGVAGPAVNLTVYSDGSGDFSSVSAALAWCNASGDAASLGHVTLRLRGIFAERVEVPVLFAAGVTLVGEGATPYDALIIASRGGAAYSTWWAHTMRVDAPDVTLINVAIANNASGYDAQVAGQAPALHLGPHADRFSCFGCALLGAQDTLYTGPAGYGLRSFFAAPFINGTCDAIFGGSASVFDAATLNMSSTVTAPRGDPRSGYLFTRAALGGAGTLLGRPWGQLSAVVWKDAAMSAAVQPAGWSDFEHDCAHTAWCADLTFAEYNSTGPGGAASQRVPWSKQLDAAEAAAWNATRLLGDWQPARALHASAAEAALSLESCASALGEATRDALRAAIAAARS